MLRPFLTGATAAAAATLVLGPVTLPAGSTPPLGPLAQQFQLTLEPGQRTELLGPLFFHEDRGLPGDVTTVWSIPPLLSHGFNRDIDYEFYDFLWKGATYNRYGKEYRIQILQWLSFAGGVTQTDTNVDRFTLFPFYFQQRSSIPEKNYTALLPFYGTLKGRFFRDEIFLFLFPLYSQTLKRGVTTDNYVYPFFHVRHGEGLRGWQFWPLAGHEHKTLTWRTNNWGDGEPIPGHNRSFVLWPIWSEARDGLGLTNVVHQQALLPFYSLTRSPGRDSTSYGWPFGVTHTLERERKYEEWGAPWPLIVFAQGEGKTTRRVWPLFGRARNSGQESSFYLWPVYKSNRLFGGALERERIRILFYLYSDATVQNKTAGTSQTLRDLWPLYTYRREFDGRSRLQVLAPLEPFLPGNTSVERDLSPLWSLWRSQHNPTNGLSSQSLLWNLYRREAGPEARKCSLLFGLFQYHSNAEGRRWRLFGLPLGKKSPPARPPDGSRRGEIEAK